jgi:hypothetical protein
MRRILGYMTAWGIVIVTAMILRFTVLRGSTSNERFLLTMFVLLSTAVIFMAASLYESRRLAVLCGFRGRGTFGVLRAWIKTAHIEIAADDDQVPKEAHREWRAFRLCSTYAFASMIIVIPVLVF